MICSSMSASLKSLALPAIIYCSAVTNFWPSTVNLEMKDEQGRGKMEEGKVHGREPLAELAIALFRSPEEDEAVARHDLT